MKGSFFCGVKLRVRVRISCSVGLRLNLVQNRGACWYVEKKKANQVKYSDTRSGRTRIYARLLFVGLLRTRFRSRQISIGETPFHINDRRTSSYNTCFALKGHCVLRGSRYHSSFNSVFPSTVKLYLDDGCAYQSLV